MNKQKSISIVTVCWNEAPQIRQTCQSVVEQVQTPCDWVVVDGGSDDGTLDILAEYKDSISTLISEPDQGVYDAMNKGITRVQGDYILFLNGGDYLASPQALTGFSQVDDADVIYGDLLVTDADKQEQRIQFQDDPSGDYLLGNWLPHPASIFARKRFSDWGMYSLDYRIAADYELFIRWIVSHQCSTRHVSEAISVFDFTGLSGSPRHQKRKAAEAHRIKKQYFPNYSRSMKSIRRDFSYAAKKLFLHENNTD